MIEIEARQPSLSLHSLSAPAHETNILTVVPEDCTGKFIRCDPSPFKGAVVDRPLLQRNQPLAYRRRPDTGKLP